jgi:tRNA dimethylallyltransferase
MILVLTGPTGVGKSELAIALAKKVNGEIINADAFQVYEGLTIATAVPTEAMKKEVPHHLYSFVHLDEHYDIFHYQVDCRKEIEDVLARGKTPILVGGSGLYIRSALYDYDLSLDTSKVDLTSYEALSNDELHKKLEELDIVEAQKLHPNNRRRVLRDIAICLASGTSKTALLAKQSHEPIYPTKFFALTKERDELYPLVEQRVEKMFASGLLNETLPLIKQYGRSAPAFQAIGVKELFPYLDKKISLEEAKTQIKEDTRHYIKRQETFFAHQFPIVYIKGEEDIEL